MDELEDQGILDKPIGQKLTFHETSIYDHTIYEAFSEVLMNLIPSETLGQYENLLNSLHLVSLRPSERISTVCKLRSTLLVMSPFSRHADLTPSCSLRTVEQHQIRVLV
jgi:hypothetical protein